MQGNPRSDAADQQLRPRHRPRGGGVAPCRSDEQHRGRRLDDGDRWNVLPAGHAPTGGRLAALGQLLLEFYITPWGFLKGAAESNATASRRRVDGKNYTVLTWSPKATAPSGRNYVINGYVNDQNIVERVETWLGENIMGDMHIVATYTGWKDFGGVIAPSRIVQTRGGWPFFDVT